MKKILLICSILFLAGMVQAQSRDSLKYELSYYKSEEKYGDKIALAYKLHEIAPFDRQAVDYICRYYYDRKIDSVGIFLDKLVKDFPNKTEAYILKAEHLSFDKRANGEIDKVKYLNRAYTIDSLDIDVNYKLAELYYMDFLKPYFKFSWGVGVKEDNKWDEHPKKNSIFKNSADSALFYLYNLQKISPSLNKEVYFPIQQLEKFKNKNWNIGDINSIDNNCYFPVWYFMNLQDGWEDDLSKNYLSQTSTSPSQYLSAFLQSIEEPCLYNNDQLKTQDVYRFTWLRSFDNPVCIRLERQNEEYILHWKLLEEAKGFDYGKLVVSESKKLTAKQWNEFITLFEKTDFNNLSNRVYYPMTDGATWILEHKTPDTFKAHYTNIPSKAIKESCVYLLKLTNLEIADKDIY